MSIKKRRIRIKKIKGLLLAAALVAVATVSYTSYASYSRQSCIKTGEHRTRSQTICTYSCGGREKKIILDAYGFCPFNVYD